MEPPPFLSPPAKRSLYTATSASAMHEPNHYSPTAATSFKRSKPPQSPLPVPPGHAFFRLLCHASRIGGVIGKSGAIIKRLQQSTSSKIRVEDSDSDDRVIVIIASNSVNRKITLSEGSLDEVDVSSAQEALVRVFERILDVAAETDGVSVVTGGVVSCRLLTEGNQAGSVIGKGGKVIESIKKESGCKIRVLSSDKLPSCALPTEEMVEIEGNILGIKKALVAVSRRLQDSPPLERTRMTMGAVPEETFPDMRMDLPPPRGSALQPLGRPLSLEADRVPPMDLRTPPPPPSPPQEVVFRILCSSDRVGGVIGKGGTIIRALQNETGAQIVVGASIAECDDRVITITCMENPESQYSSAQKAAVLVFNRCVEAGIENGVDLGSPGSPVSARIVVPSNQVGCLLGKGGAIVSEMRRLTGTGIRIIGGNQVPKCCSENDQVVQITGEFVNVRDALHRVTSRLRENLFPNRMLNGAGTRNNNSSLIAEPSPYGRVWDPPPSLGFHSSGGLPHNRSQHANLTQSMDHLGLSHNSDHPPSPRLWASQTPGGLHPRSGPDGGRGLASVKGGTELGSGNRSAIVTNTTVEIVVPENVIGSVYGENGSNLTRLRQISGAKVVVHEPRPGTTDRMVVISGTPDETQAAQSLLHAFILTGSS
ncbi:hypothetical protein LguiA_027255 [Lonicera macranthoides]